MCGSWKTTRCEFTSLNLPVILLLGRFGMNCPGLVKGILLYLTDKPRATEGTFINLPFKQTLIHGQNWDIMINSLFMSMGKSFFPARGSVFSQ